MKRIGFLSLIFVLIAAFVDPAQSQFKNQGLGGGIGFGGFIGRTNVSSDNAFAVRGFLRYGLVKMLQGEIGVGFGHVSGDEYDTRLIPIEYRFLFSPISAESWNPYLYAGFGGLHYDYITLPAAATPGLKASGWTGVVPAGIGLQAALGDRVSFEVSGGYNYSLSKNLEAITGSKNDAYISYFIGLTVSGESGDADPDGDGLTNREEKELGTDPKKADTDGDGLSDGDEVHKYNTNPVKADSDGDGLSDGDEVSTYHTDPNKADTDGDGLSDGAEVSQYHTDPVKVDTDGDGLSDGDEVTKYKTDPTKGDTDGDGLSDYDEVMKYKTDPLKMDTDGGSVNDGKEIANGTNPLEPGDDVPKPKLEVGKAMVLEGIVFKSGKATIDPSSEPTLMQALEAFEKFPTATVEIRGYTDNVGKASSNKKLSLARAEAVKSWLVMKGVDAMRITTKGFGPENPIADNKTAEGKAKNRRIEFFRTK